MSSISIEIPLWAIACFLHMLAMPVPVIVGMGVRAVRHRGGARVFALLSIPCAAAVYPLMWVADDDGQFAAACGLAVAGTALWLASAAASRFRDLGLDGLVAGAIVLAVLGVVGHFAVPGILR